MTYIKIVLTAIALFLAIRCSFDILPGIARAQAPGVQDVNIARINGHYFIGDSLPVKVK